MADDSSYMSASQSQLLSSSTSSLSPSKLCSKTYKKASNLYLTLRLQEALSALEPAITVVRGADEQFVNGDDSVAPVASAQPTWRIKVWNLYITLLSQIIELGPEEGKKLFGQKEWKAISTTVRDGEIWETVVRTGGSSTPRANGGTDTPKDLAARVRIIELFTLHVLPANEEWEYAQEFINLSEVLDEDRKELFLQTLEGLKEEKQQGELRAAALQREKDAELERQAREAERRRVEEAEAAERAQKGHGRSGSEVDYGIEKTYPNGSIKGKGRFAEKQSSKPGTSAGRTAFSPPGSKNIKKTEKPEARAKQSRALINVVRNILKYVSKSIAGNPLSFARTLLFMLGIIAALSRQDVRERIRRITGSGWQKIKGTVGMGVKVSYI
ncbi:microbody (peroxisome) proliferation protein peroxin 26 [Aspergillus luchuensis]|uniref:Microbody (Peroxisome) proliferation protein peroxin 26 n=1 Tax=Aspergillus kawachii TaxID=1069201 RepID=A0A146FKH7_ASPKA|nr:microbody (peroxisome) proliferation protein peroxin 26 [Aspergillus luchuensis]